MTIKIDYTSESVVVVCLACGGEWRAFAWSKLEAWESAAAHEKRAHPGEEQAQKALVHARRTARHAV